MLVKGIKLTMDLTSCHYNGICPMLNLEVWMDRREDGSMRVIYSFFKKEMVAPTVFHAMGAHGWRSKIVTMTDELRRRLLKMDRKKQSGGEMDICEKIPAEKGG